MKVMWKAACAAVLVVTTTSILIGCGSTYRPIAVPLPVTTGNPTGAEVEVVLNTAPGVDSVITSIDVSGDSNAGNKSLGTVAGSASGTLAANMAAPIAFNAGRTAVLTANTAADSVTQVLLAASTAGLAANTTTLSLDPGSQPIGVTFQYFGIPYTQDYVVNTNSGVGSDALRTCAMNVGSLGAITQPTPPAISALKATICLDTPPNPNTPANPFPHPVFAWIYTDQTKVFVLDNVANLVDVVSASKYKVTNTIAVGIAPIKATQSTDGSFIYVLNSGNGAAGSISIIDGQAETVVGTATFASVAPPIDIVQDVQFNRIWVLQSDGMVSVFDATIPGALTLVKAFATTATPTNLAVMRDGTQAYVGVAGKDQIIAIRASDFTTHTIPVGVHRTIQQTVGGQNLIVEQTTPMVTYVAVSRDNTKVYATTTTATTYFYFDSAGNPSAIPSASFPDLYNGTAVVTAVGNGATPINTYVTTVPAPSVGSPYCDPPITPFDAQKACPAMTPVIVLGRS